MSSQPLIQTEEVQTVDSDPKQKLKRAGRWCASFCAGIAAVLFILTWIVQGIIYWYATFGCSPKDFGSYEFPGGGTSNLGGPEYNLVPQISLLTESPPNWIGESFAVLPSNEMSTAAGAPVGTWWRVGGPIFDTYTYEDVANSRVTIYMRRNLLRIGMSHRIGRCDGKGPLITFTEGSNWFMNRIRLLFKFNQALSFKIYVDNDLVAVAEETSLGFPSVTFRNQQTGEEVGSSVLSNRHFHGQYDQWLVNNQNSKTVFPYFVSNAASLLFAFNTARHKPDTSQSMQPPVSLGTDTSKTVVSSAILPVPHATETSKKTGVLQNVQMEPRPLVKLTAPDLHKFKVSSKPSIDRARAHGEPSHTTAKRATASMQNGPDEPKVEVKTSLERMQKVVLGGQ